MTLRDLLNTTDADETVQVSFCELITSDNFQKLEEPLNILDMDVKRIKTNGCAMLFVDIGRTWA